MLSDDRTTRQPTADDAAGWLDRGMQLLDIDQIEDALAAFVMATELRPTTSPHGAGTRTCCPQWTATRRRCGRGKPSPG